MFLARDKEYDEGAFLRNISMIVSISFDKKVTTDFLCREQGNRDLISWNMGRFVMNFVVLKNNLNLESHTIYIALLPFSLTLTEMSKSRYQLFHIRPNIP